MARMLDVVTVKLVEMRVTSVVRLNNPTVLWVHCGSYALSAVHMCGFSLVVVRGLNDGAGTFPFTAIS